MGYDALLRGIRCIRSGIRCTEKWDTVHWHMGCGARYPQSRYGWRPSAARDGAIRLNGANLFIILI